MSKWKKFTGSEEQISEILNAKDDVKLKYTDGREGLFSFLTKGMIKRINIQSEGIQGYLICHPHPHADMIIEWARTGREIYWYSETEMKWICTNRPSWNPGSRYSFNSDGESIEDIAKHI